jgi:hypothetical protein
MSAESSLHPPPHTRDEIYDAVAWIRGRFPQRVGRDYARRLALSGTVRGRDFWFAVTEILGGDVTGWRK